MKKITEEGYFLPLIEALSGLDFMDSGRTSPLLISGVCSISGIKGDYVAKLKGSPEMLPASFGKELIGVFIAMELGFCIASPAIINFSEDFISTMDDNDRYAMVAKSLGRNFGSELKKGFWQPVIDDNCSDEMLVKYAELFAFDVLIGNPDRRIDKPNFLTNGKDLFIFDHELAFSFNEVFSFARNHQPWLIQETDKTWISKNYCFQVLQGKNIDFASFLNKLVLLNDNFWQRVEKELPEEWNPDGLLESIKAYLNQIIRNSKVFASELNRILL